MNRRAYLILALLVAVLGMAMAGTFHYRSVCSHCGALRESTRWQIPCTRVTLFETHHVETTAFSDFAIKQGHREDRPHEWVFAQGSVNGVTCAIGRGRHLLPIVETIHGRQLVEYCFHSNAELGQRLLDAALDPEKAPAVYLLSFGLSEYSSKPQGSFMVWKQDHDKEISDLIGPKTNPPNFDQ